MVIFEIAKNGIWSKRIREIDLFDFTSFFGLDLDFFLIFWPTVQNILYLFLLKGRPSSEHDENVFQSLVDLHAIVDKEESNSNPDKVVDEVLQEFEKLKLGISQKYVELLGIFVKDKNVLNRLEVLKKNYYNLQNSCSSKVCIVI